MSYKPILKLINIKLEFYAFFPLLKLFLQIDGTAKKRPDIGTKYIKVEQRSDNHLTFKQTF